LAGVFTIGPETLLTPVTLPPLWVKTLMTCPQDVLIAPDWCLKIHDQSSSAVSFSLPEGFTCISNGRRLPVSVPEKLIVLSLLFHGRPEVQTSDRQNWRADRVRT
jgi:hypothetical protein